MWREVSVKAMWRDVSVKPMGRDVSVKAMWRDVSVKAIIVQNYYSNVHSNAEFTPFILTWK